MCWILQISFVTDLFIHLLPQQTLSTGPGLSWFMYTVNLTSSSAALLMLNKNLNE